MIKVIYSSYRVLHAVTHQPSYKHDLPNNYLTLFATCIKWTVLWNTGMIKVIYSSYRVLHAVETLNVDHLDGVNVWEINSFSVLDNKDRSLFLEDVSIDQIFFCDVGNALRGGRRPENCRYRECAECLNDSDCSLFNEA